MITLGTDLLVKALSEQLLDVKIGPAGSGVKITQINTDERSLLITLSWTGPLGEEFTENRRLSVSTALAAIAQPTSAPPARPIPYDTRTMAEVPELDPDGAHADALAAERTREAWVNPEFWEKARESLNEGEGKADQLAQAYGGAAGRVIPDVPEPVKTTRDSNAFHGMVRFSSESGSGMLEGRVTSRNPNLNVVTFEPNTRATAGLLAALDEEDENGWRGAVDLFRRYENSRPELIGTYQGHAVEGSMASRFMLTAVPQD